MSEVVVTRRGENYTGSRDEGVFRRRGGRGVKGTCRVRPVNRGTGNTGQKSR